FAGSRGVQNMMEVVVPLRRVKPAVQQARVILLILEHEMNVAVIEGGTNALRQFLEDVIRTIVHDGVHRIQTQSIEMKLPNPVERVVNEEFAYKLAARAIEVDPGSPGSFVP